MKNILTICLYIFILYTNTLLSSDFKTNNSGYIYISPLPGSEFVSEETNIILRTEYPVQRINATENSITVTGSRSGLHTGIISQSGENTILFKPHQPFTLNEKVNVIINKFIRTKNAHRVRPYSFSFIIRPEKIKEPLTSTLYDEMLFHNQNELNNLSLNLSSVFRSDTLPSDFPEISVSQYGETAPGYIFITNLYFTSFPSPPPYLMILENSGIPFFYRKMPENCFDFKLQNDLITYFDDKFGDFRAMDSTYTVVDSFKCSNGYSTDVHELRLLPDGHALMLSYDPETVDMSQIVPNGDPNAIVIGLIVQEIDRNKNVVFQWRSWDHFKITDATHENLTAHFIDYVHGNAIELDDDGNIIVSSRHMDELTKINRLTGQIIWRMGGKNNQFSFPNDPIGFSHQHAVRLLDNHHLTLFDNGNYHEPPFSRAVEYVIDEHTKIASLVWQYRHNPDLFGSAMGYVQRLSNGNTLIGWGSATPILTEVRPDGAVVYELSLPRNIYSYRAYRFTLDFSKNLQKPKTPYEFRLAQNYPNPFNSGTTIFYTLGANSNVSLTVYDILGRKIQTLADEFQNIGNHLYTFNSTNLSSGAYFYVLRTDTFSDSKKMILSK
jgi:hypothetical protein